MPSFRIVILAVLLPALSQAAVCLRFPGTSLRQLPARECQDSLLQFEREGRQSQLLGDFEEFLNDQDRSPKKAWRNFIETALKKNWSSEDEAMVSDVIAWAQRQNWKIAPELTNQLGHLQGRQEMQLAIAPGRSSLIEKISLLPGFEDVQIITPISNGETENQVLDSKGPRRWIVMSSVYQARTFWAESSRLLALVQNASFIPWVEGECRRPVFAKVKTTKFEMRAYDQKGCATPNLARISDAQNGLALDPNFGNASSSGIPQLQESKSNHWLWISLLAGAAAAYGLRDKTLVITHGFGR